MNNIKKGRKVAAKQSAAKHVNIANNIKLTLEELNVEFKKAGYELVIRRPLTKDLVAFDYALLFTRNSSEAQIYVDSDLQTVIDHLLETNEQVVIKCNWLSPDTQVLTVPRLPVEATGDVLSDDTELVVSG